MKKDCSLFLIVAMVGVAFAAPTVRAWGYENIERVVFTKNRSFEVTTSASATKLQNNTPFADIYFFNRAEQTCKINSKEVQNRLNYILQTTSTIWKELSKLNPESRNALNTKKVRLVIDDFTDFAGANPAFSSYFTQTSSGPVIGIDCSSPEIRNYWLQSLSHEVVHALLSSENVESWWEEGLAQLIEAKMNGDQPFNAVQHLSEGNGIVNGLPSLFETSRPFHSQTNYALSYLFVRYIEAQFQGMATLHAMTFSRVNDCEEEADFLARISCRGKVFLKNRLTNEAVLEDEGLNISKMTSMGLLRFFYVSLLAGKTEDKRFQIPGWKGFRSMPFSESGDSHLERGQMKVFRDFNRAVSSTSAELYQMSFLPLGQFEVSDVTTKTRGNSFFIFISK